MPWSLLDISLARILDYKCHNLEQAAEEKREKENLIFLINSATIAMVAEDTKSTKDEPQTFYKALNHVTLESLRKLKEAIQKEFL